MLAWTRRFIVWVIAAFVVSIAMYERARATEGILDGSFGGGPGTVLTDFGSNGEAYAIAIQADGRIVAAGITGPANDPFHDQIALVRYYPDGSLDPSFGNGGRVTGTATGRQALAVAIQTDGKILAAGFGLSNVTRFNSDGSLDTSFGSDGETGSLLHPYTMLLLPNGKILVGGYFVVSYHTTNFAVGRYNSDGTVDTSFGSGGRVTTGFFGGHDEIHALAIQPDGKIVAAGQATAGGEYWLAALARYDANGNLDTSFGNSGKVTTDFSPAHGMKYHRLYAVAVQPDGRILAAGATRNYDDTQDSFAIARYNADGGPDSTFGNNGQVTTKIFGNPSTASALALQRGGKFLVAGTSSAFGLARYNYNGSLDTNFGPNHNGQVMTYIIGSETVSAMALQRDGRVVLAGSSSSDVALARYLVKGGGPAISDFNGDGQSDLAVFRQSDGAWLRLDIGNGSIDSTQWGASSDKLVPGDYDGDGKTDIAVWRPSEGNWYVSNQTTRGWGGMGDQPVPADYDGDGKTDIAVWRPSEGNWYIVNSASGNVTVRSWGASTDVPVLGDFDGDGKSDIAVYRPSEGNWYIINSSTNTLTLRAWGATGDKPVPADYDGDGATDIAIFRPSEGNWYISNSCSGTVTLRNWGAGTDKLVPADYDGDGKADIAVYRPSEGNWYIIQSSNAALSIKNLGLSGDTPVPNTYLPQ